VTNPLPKGEGIFCSFSPSGEGRDEGELLKTITVAKVLDKDR